MGERLKVSEDYSSALNKTLKFLSFRQRTSSEIQKYLQKIHASEEAKTQVISKLEQLNLINDKAFINWWVEQRSAYRPRALRFLKIELKQKGISQELLDSVLSEYSASDEEKSAKTFAEKKLQRIKNLPGIEIKKKLFQALSSRGFSYNVIQSVVDNLLKKE